MGCLIQEVQVGSTVRRQFFSFMDRLSASTYTSAWTGHDFYKMIVYFSLTNCFHQISCILKSTNNCNLYHIACNIKFRFCPSIFIYSTDFFECISITPPVAPKITPAPVPSVNGASNAESFNIFGSMWSARISRSNSLVVNTRSTP